MPATPKHKYFSVIPGTEFHPTIQEHLFCFEFNGNVIKLV